MPNAVLAWLVVGIITSMWVLYCTLKANRKARISTTIGSLLFWPVVWIFVLHEMFRKTTGRE
jgi:hypothetical protein